MAATFPLARAAASFAIRQGRERHVGQPELIGHIHKRGWLGVTAAVLSQVRSWCLWPQNVPPTADICP